MPNACHIMDTLRMCLIHIVRGDPQTDILNLRRCKGAHSLHAHWKDPPIL